MTVELFVNDASTTVVDAGGHAAVAAGTVETWHVASSALFSDVNGQTAQTGVAQFRIVDQADTQQPPEIILVTNSPGTAWTVTRGAEGTTPTAHAQNCTVEAVVTSASLSGFDTPAARNASITAALASLGTAATHAATDFDAAGAATSAVTTAESYADTGDALALKKASNLSDLANAGTARTNLGLGSLATVTPTGTPDGTKFLRDDDVWAAPSVLTIADVLFGDGSDGDVTISTTVTITRDMLYNSLHVTSTGRLIGNSSRVFVKTTCTVDAGGSIDADGVVWSGTQGSGGAALGRGGPGGQGGTAPGGAGSAGGATSGYRYGVGAGGAGGAGAIAGGAGGAGGGTPNPVTDGAAGPAIFRTLPSMLTLNPFWAYFTSFASLTGASGGGGGGASNDGSANGAAGGGGGGILILAARVVVNNGRISANGYPGSIRSDISGGANKAGGSGGGGGGIALVHTASFTGNAPQANGGAGGNTTGSGGTGAVGSAGTAGTALVNTWA